jgi:peptide/nickel transport system substrate-binding protein
MARFTKQRERTSKLVKNVGDKALTLQSSSSKHVSKYLTKRVSRVQGVKRFLASWLALVLGLILATFGTILQLQRVSLADAPANGGVYNEGMIGKINNLNPLFAGGVVDDSAAKLIFNGLLRHDTDGQLVADLATDWHVDENKNNYIVNLRRDVQWHDGQPFTSEDVAYTIETIQNPATRSTLFASWQGVKVIPVTRYQVRFELPAVFAPFSTALTVPILPKHLLVDIEPARLRTAPFNTQPVGTGPFIMQALRNEVKQQQLELTRNEEYYRGSPRLERFILHTYENSEALATALKEREITAAVDLESQVTKSFENDRSIRLGEIPLNNGVFAFFKTTAPLLGDANVRRALASAIDRRSIISIYKARYGTLKTPLLPNHQGYDVKYAQKTNLAEARSLLDQANWKVQPGGSRAKDGAKIELNLVTVNSTEYSIMANELKRQWEAIGVGVKVQELTPEQLQQNALTAHSYDILLYGISLGTDPDVYAYWHSSQARSGGLNFSEWSSGRADSSLDVARTRLEAVLRNARYQTFQDEWLKSAPAVALYQPRTSYAYHQNAKGFIEFPSNSAADRLTNVEEWTVSTKTVQRTP